MLVTQEGERTSRVLGVHIVVWGEWEERESIVLMIVAAV